MHAKLPLDAFQHYVALGPDRSYQAVAKHYGVTKRAVTKRAATERWQQRVAELESQARRTAEQRALETLEEMNTRHLKSLRVIQGKALEALRSSPIETAMDAVRALDIGIRQERLVRGEPSERTAVGVEEVIRREYDRWLGTTEEESDGAASE